MIPTSLDAEFLPIIDAMRPEIAGAAVSNAFSGSLVPPPGGNIAPGTNTLKEVKQIRTDCPVTWLWLNETTG